MRGGAGLLAAEDTRLATTAVATIARRAPTGIRVFGPSVACPCWKLLPEERTLNLANGSALHAFNRAPPRVRVYKLIQRPDDA